jgi:hypothetical protein
MLAIARAVRNTETTGPTIGVLPYHVATPPPPDPAARYLSLLPRALANTSSETPGAPTRSPTPFVDVDQYTGGTPAATKMCDLEASFCKSVCCWISHRSIAENE